MLLDVLKNNLNEATLLLIGAGLFAFYFPKRNSFIIRIIAAILISYGISVLLAWYMSYAITAGGDTFVTATRLNYTILMIAVMGASAVCFRMDVFEAIMMGLFAYATENITSQLKQFLSYASITNMGLQYTLEVIIIVATYVVVFFAGARNFRKGVASPNKPVLFINLVCLIVTCIILPTMFYAWNDLGVDEEFYDISMLTVSFISFSFDILTIVVETALVLKNRTERESRKLQEMLDKSSRQYEISKDMIAMVNRKYHDMKHYITASAGLDAQSAEETAKAIGMYDNIYNTGNKALDIVLSEKAIKCGENGITLSCMAHGELLDFMSQTDIYSVFGNALDNAIEEVVKYEGERRIISVRMDSYLMMTRVHFENYCETPPKFKGGMPQTTKGSTSVHGYGVESIRYITEKYGGNFSVRVRDSMFEIDLLFCRPSAGNAQEAAPSNAAGAA